MNVVYALAFQTKESSDMFNRPFDLITPSVAMNQSQLRAFQMTNE